VSALTGPQALAPVWKARHNAEHMTIG